MNSIFYIGESKEKLDAQKVQDHMEIQQLIHEFQNGSILAYLKLLDLCTPVAFYKVMNETINRHGKYQKLKDVQYINKQNILVYSVVIKEKNEFVYHVLYEYRQDEKDILSYYKRNQTMFALINEAIIKQDFEFLQSISPYLSLFPCYDKWTKEEGFIKKLTMRG